MSFVRVSIVVIHLQRSFNLCNRFRAPDWTSGADQLSLIGFPDPFAVATVGGEQTHTTSVIKKTLNPYWNEPFDLYVVFFSTPHIVMV